MRTYSVIKSTDLIKFVDGCNELLAAGATPLGGMSVTTVGGRETYHQAFMEERKAPTFAIRDVMLDVWFNPMENGWEPTRTKDCEFPTELNAKTMMYQMGIQQSRLLIIPSEE